MRLTKTNILLAAMFLFLPVQSVLGYIGVKALKLQSDTIQRIYQETLKVNKLLDQGQNVLAIEKANATIDSFPASIFQSRYLGYLYYYKGNAYRSLGNYYLSEKCLLLADQFFHSYQDTLSLIDSKINYLSTLMEGRKYENAKLLALNLLEDYGKAMNNDNLANTHANLAALGIRMNDTVLANRNFDKVFQLNKGIKHGEYAFFITERNYGRYLFKQNRFSESEKYLKNTCHIQSRMNQIGLSSQKKGGLFLTKLLQLHLVYIKTQGIKGILRRHLIGHFRQNLFPLTG